MEITAQHLLSKISSINKKYEEIAKLTGEKFNVFEILNLTTNETRTHSAFIAALLNPKGTHELGSIMLKHFLEIIKFTDLDVETTSIHIERGIGYVSQDYSEGGRIDIIIEDTKGNGVVIENKIYAPDQLNQMERYYKYATNKYKKWKLLYLTLDGKLANTSLENGNDYTCISYKKDITEWLEKCKKEAANFPLLRETIAQYLTLIKNLTNQSINKKMEKEIINEMIASKDTFDASFAIVNAFKEAKVELFNKMKEKLIEWGRNKDGIKYDVEDDDWGWEKESYLSFVPYKNENIKISLGFDNWFADFCIGVVIKENDSVKRDENIKNELSKIDLLGEDKGWDNWTYLHYLNGDWSNWNDRKFVWEGMVDAENGETITQLKKWIVEITKTLDKLDLLKTTVQLTQ